MEAEADSAGGVYVYAIVGGELALDYGSIGLDGSPVYKISAPGMAALASQLARSRVRPERRHLAAHNAVLRRALASGEPAVLPLAFGLIADEVGTQRA